jgi:hypothetical protein
LISFICLFCLSSLVRLCCLHEWFHLWSVSFMEIFKIFFQNLLSMFWL